MGGCKRAVATGGLDGHRLKGGLLKSDLFICYAQGVTMREALKEISIILDVWDDIFSDFDPRPLDERALSQDFIGELHKRYTETAKGELLISFYAPKSLQNEQSEKMVVHRLRKYFKEQAQERRREISHMRIRGTVFVLIGFVSLTSITLMSFFKMFSALTDQLLQILLVPFGWFGLWEGLAQIVNASPSFASEERLCRKLANAEYRFNYGS